MATPVPKLNLRDPLTVGGESKARTVPYPGKRFVIPAVFVLGWTAILLSAFSPGLGRLQSLPVFVFCSLLLLYFQGFIDAERTYLQFAYRLFTSVFTLVYAAALLFDESPTNFTRQPYTYVIIDLLLILAFVVDAIRRRTRDLRLLRLPRGDDVAVRRRVIRLPYRKIAADFAGFAILSYVSALLLDLLNRQLAMQALGLPFPLAPHYVAVNLNELFGLSLSSNIATLEGFEFLLAIGASVISLALLSIVVGFAVNAEDIPGAADRTSNVRFRVTISTVRQIVRDSGDNVRISLRLVLGPLVWLVPAFCAGAFSRQVVQYLNISAHWPGSHYLDLFNPLSAASVANFSSGLLDVLYGVIAVLAVIVAVAGSYPSTNAPRTFPVARDSADAAPVSNALSRTLATLGSTSLTIAATAAGFLYTLAGLNAIAIYLQVTNAAPLQVGAPGLFAVIAAIIVFAFGYVRELRSANADPSGGTSPHA